MTQSSMLPCVVQRISALQLDVEFEWLVVVYDLNVCTF
jgi:hypothetical protein